MPSLRDRLRALFAAAPVLPTGELAVSDTRRAVTGFPATFYNPDDLARRRGSFAIYDEMRHDEQVKACLALKKAAVVGPGWSMEPVDRRNDTEAAFADELTAQLEGVSGTFADVLMGMLSALDYGFSLSSIVLTADPDLHLEAVKSIAPHDVEFQVDPYGTVTDIIQRAGGQTIRIPPMRVVHFVHEPEFGNPYGRSDLRAAYRSWWHKKNWVQWWAIWGEKFADAPVIAAHPAQVSQEKVSEVLDALDALQARNSIAVPEGWAVSLLEGSRDPKNVFEGAINRHDLGIAKALLVPEKLGVVGGEDKGGSYALSKTHLGAFFYVIDLLKGRLEASIQDQLIWPLGQMLAPNVPLPQFKIRSLTEENKVAIATAYIAAVTGKATPIGYEDDKWFRDTMTLPDLTQEEYDARIADAAQKAADIAAATAPTQPAAGNTQTPPTPGTKKAFAARGPLPARAVADRTSDVPTALTRPLTFIEQRADMQEKLLTFETLTPKLSETLAAGAEAVVQDVQARVRRLGLAKPDAAPKEILGLTAGKGLLNELRTSLSDQLFSAYETGAKQAKGEIRRAKRK